MRIVLIGVFPFRDSDGGAAGRLRNFGLALRRAGAEPALWFTGGGTAPRESSWEEIPVVEFTGEPSRRRRWWRERVHAPAVTAMTRRLAELGRAGRIDAVLFYNQDAVYAWQVARACSRSGVPFFQQYAEMHLPSDYQRGWMATHFLLEWLHLRLAPRLSAGSIVISRELQGQLARRSRREPLLVPTIASLRTAGLRRLAVPPRLVCVSTGTRRDEVPLLLRAHARARQGGAVMQLDVVGLSAGSQADLARLVRALGAEDSVRLRGLVSEPEYNAELEGADAFVLLRSDDRSSRACYPSKLGGMFATGAPVILSAVGDLTDHFRDRHDCFLVAPGDVDALAEAIGWLVAHPAEAAEIGRRGNARARELFDVETAGRRILNYLRACLNPDSPT